ncbi:hypothetical protein SCLCIDRAFT_657082 [Scleroderma citrinum Foug A]|uniref:Uncharacterized protein n=1 Tax=Scleroderma citrinum Foug A TaxID=1036808 RepID=A0A0C3DU21_9AGAM|nr:hypothetical protein SCLCIDRAFT_657082 [Scleroderma citrinum Foug A]
MLVQTPLDPPSQTVACAESPVNPLPPSVPSITPIQSHTAHPDHPWLQAILELPDCPPLLHNVDSGMVPTFSKHMPESIQQVVRVIPVGCRFPPVLVFQSPVQSGFFAFFGATGPRLVFKILQTCTTTTTTTHNWLHMVA